MKKIAKILMVTLLVIVAAVSVSAAEVELTLTDAGTQGEYTSGVYYLDVVASDDLYINVLDLKFTYNTEKIELFCLDVANYGAFPLNEEIDPEWYLYAETALVLGTNGKTGLQKATFSKAYVNATVDGNYCTAQFVANAPTGKVTKFPKENFKVYQIGLYIPGDVTALTSDDFKIEHMYMGTWDGVESGETYNYGYGSWSEPVAGKIAVTNNVVDEPEVVVITIPVLAGDKVYLQDGTVATMAEANNAYEVPATVGYVAVNTGKTAQKTYYVDGTAATLVHTNGIVSTEENDLRGPDETSSVAEDTSGLRFLMNHNPTNEGGRFTPGHEITEIGVLMTVESTKVIAGIGQDTVDNLKVGNVGSFVKSGYALGNGYDRAFNTEDDENWIISAVMYNIKLNAANVQVNIVCRPFYKVGDTYIYGETMKATLYDVAKSIKDGGYVGCSDELKAYVDEIVTLVDGVDTPVVEDEVIIDISSLYTIAG